MITSTTPSPPNSPEAAKPPGMSNMWQRIISGAIGAVVLLGCIWYSGFTFGLFFGVVQARMLWEFYRMMRVAGYQPAAMIGTGTSIVVFGLLYVLGDVDARPYETIEPVLLTLASLILIVPLVFLLREMAYWNDSQEHQPFANLGVAMGGLFYVSLPMSLLCLIGFTEEGYDYRRIFGLLFLVWAADTGAYIAGKSFGKHKLAPSISPGKTWEGWLGGTLLTLAVGWGLGYLLPDMPLAHRLVAAAVVAVFGVLGDLAESMLKRSVGVKDSGRILPGHGGLLDRFDAFLFIVPVLVVLLLLFDL
ncbi:phosphatidate cytidylyltransferase [Solirubrum puertoriconensis]|uniref:Phosphatidate cytidylyltransferase n=1 Tax=Solirubrum puertoriconensis TaxID=1751427 RepID=A0A9X0HHQ2_SOLP1|nr:phosphatidate cytidylyltransferase [Solirubrum puertoriconensis]KUG06062.1 hypothetical protein ASU33_01455 [Solirubrum puertoriconensis]